VRRTISIGIFGAATTIAVVIGSQGAATSPVSPTAATATGAATTQLAPAATSAEPPEALTAPRRGQGHRRR
jgi:hypothetical protein